MWKARVTWKRSSDDIKYRYASDVLFLAHLMSRIFVEMSTENNVNQSVSGSIYIHEPLLHLILVIKNSISWRRVDSETCGTRMEGPRPARFVDTCYVMVRTLATTSVLVSRNANLFTCHLLDTLPPNVLLNALFYFDRIRA